MEIRTIYLSTGVVIKSVTNPSLYMGIVAAASYPLIRERSDSYIFEIPELKSLGAFSVAKGEGVRIETPQRGRHAA